MDTRCNIGQNMEGKAGPALSTGGIPGLYPRESGASVLSL
jgi:hypothetical protein